MSRSDKIVSALDRFCRDSILQGFYCYSPEGARRWVVWGPSFEKTMTTAEVEALIAGIRLARTALA